MTEYRIVQKYKTFYTQKRVEVGWWLWRRLEWQYCRTCQGDYVVPRSYASLERAKEWVAVQTNAEREAELHAEAKPEVVWP